MAEARGMRDRSLPPPGAMEALRHLRTALAQGVPVHRALLEAVGLWTAPEEVRGTRYLRYLIAGEALDLYTLAGRLLEEVDGAVPPEERRALLEGGGLLSRLPEAEAVERLGPVKHRAFLNYWYGVVVERAVQQAAVEEVCKERLARGLPVWKDPTGEAFQRLYGDPFPDLWTAFRRAWAGSLPPDPEALEKEFTYWLFRLRVARSEKARLASDTRKGLDWLAQWGRAYPWLR